MELQTHVNQILNEEIASRLANPNTSTSSTKAREVIFDVDDFSPNTALPRGIENSMSQLQCGPSESEHRNAIARMSTAWVNATQETAKLRRADGPRPTSAKHRGPDKMADIVDIEGADPSSMSFEDVEGLEDEMNSYI
jgi:hypothetical protein